MGFWTHPVTIAIIVVVLTAAGAALVQKWNHKHTDNKAITEQLQNKVDEADCLSRLADVQDRFKNGEDNFEVIKLGMVTMYEKMGGDGMEMTALLKSGKRL